MHVQLQIGTTRALLMQVPGPEKEATDKRWWFEMRDPRVSPPTVLAIRHMEVPPQGDAQFEQWLKINVPPDEHLNIPRVWAAIGHFQELVASKAASGS